MKEERLFHAQRASRLGATALFSSRTRPRHFPFRHATCHKRYMKQMNALFRTTGLWRVCIPHRNPISRVKFSHSIWFWQVKQQLGQKCKTTCLLLEDLCHESVPGKKTKQKTQVNYRFSNNNKKKASSGVPTQYRIEVHVHLIKWNLKMASHKNNTVCKLPVYVFMYAGRICSSTERVCGETLSGEKVWRVFLCLFVLYIFFPVGVGI